MKNKGKLVLMFLGGLLVGALATFIITGKASQRMWARCVATSLMEQAFIATEIRTGRQADLQQRAEANLPAGVLAIHQHRELQTVPESQSAFCAVKAFYEINKYPCQVRSQIS